MANNIMNGLHPRLIQLIGVVSDRMRSAGHPIRVIGGLRTAEEQNRLWQLGRSQRGKVVTNCDGYKLKSNHQAKADGWGHAVDVCFEGDDPFGDRQPWKLLGETVAAVGGLRWGGSWLRFPDRPHIELAAIDPPVV